MTNMLCLCKFTIIYPALVNKHSLRDTIQRTRRKVVSDMFQLHFLGTVSAFGYIEIKLHLFNNYLEIIGSI